jgi:hypothetical protein
VRPAGVGEAGRPLVDFVHDRVGSRRAQRALAFMQGWGVVADELGREPTVEEYARRFQVPIATAFRDQATFREAFPEETTPDRLLGLLWDELARAGRRHLLSQPVRVAVEGGAGASPVLAWFAATLLARLPAGAARAVDRVVPTLAASAGPRRLEARRAYVLADRAVFEWAAAILTAAEPHLADALHSLERFDNADPQPAAYAAELVRDYAAHVGREAAPGIEEAARAAGAAARLKGGGPSDEAALEAVGSHAAGALVGAFATAAAADVVGPAGKAAADLLAMAS